MGMQIVDQTFLVSNIPSATPTGAVGIDLSVSYFYDTMRPDKWVITATVTSAPSDLIVWGALAAGSPDDATDDIWGLHTDKYKVIVDGKLGSALAVGTHHFIVTDIGIYSRLYFQKTAGSIDVRITPILKSERSS